MQQQEDTEKEKLLKELKKHRDTKKALLISCNEASKELSIVKDSVKELDNNDGIWKERYEHQRSINSGLEEQLAMFNRQLEELKKDDVDSNKDDLLESDMSLFKLQQKLRHLKRKKMSLEWSLRDVEWRLDREGMYLDQTEEGLKELKTKLKESTDRYHLRNRHPLIPSNKRANDSANDESSGSDKQ